MKPSTLPRFADVDTIDPTSGITNVIEPGDTQKNTGWVYRQFPVRQFMNWLHRLTYQWLYWFNDQMDAIFDPRDYGNGLQIGANIALAADAVVAAGRGYILLNGGEYLCEVSVNFHGIPIVFSPGSYLTINAGIVITGLNISGHPKHQIIYCAVADTPIIKADSYVIPEWFGVITVSNTLYKAILAANGLEIKLTPGNMYVQASCAVDVNVNINGYGAIIQGVDPSTEIFNISQDILYFICKGVQFIFDTDPTTSEYYVLQNWITPYTPGDEHTIERLILENNDFGHLRIRFCTQTGNFIIVNNTWINNSGITKVDGEYILIGTGTEDFAALSYRGIISDNYMDVTPIDGNENIISIDGSKTGVIIKNNTIINSNVNVNAYINLFTGGNNAKVINNIFKNVQLLRKQTQTGKSNNPYPVKFDLIQGNNFELTTDFRGNLYCIQCRGSWFQIKDNTFKISYNGEVGRCIYLTLEDVDTTPLTIQTSHLGVITGNLFDLIDAKSDSVAVARVNDGDIGGYIIFANNIQRGGGYVAQLGHSIAANNIWQNTTNGAGRTCIDIDSPALAIGNMCTTEAETYIGDSFAGENPGYNRSISTTIAGGSSIDANKNDLVFVNGTGNIGITGGKIGQKLTIVCSGGSPTFVHSSNLCLQNNQNVNILMNEILVLMKITLTKWIQISLPAINTGEILMGYKYGLETEREVAAGDKYNLIIHKGIRKDIDNVLNMYLGEFKKSVIATGGTDFDRWVVGINNGGVATGIIIADDMWLHIFIIGNKLTRIIDIGLDTSITAANLKTDTTWGDSFVYNYIGSIYIYVAYNDKYKIMNYTQIKDDIFYETGITQTPTLTGNLWQEMTLTNIFCPPDIQLIVKLGQLSATHNIVIAPGGLNTVPTGIDIFKCVPLIGFSNNSEILINDQKFYIYPLTAGTPDLAIKCTGFKYLW
jgi:hypothetical protein